MTPTRLDEVRALAAQLPGSRMGALVRELLAEVDRRAVPVDTRPLHETIASLRADLAEAHAVADERAAAANRWLRERDEARALMRAQVAERDRMAAEVGQRDVALKALRTRLEAEMGLTSAITRLLGAGSTLTPRARAQVAGLLNGYLDERKKGPEVAAPGPSMEG